MLSVTPDALNTIETDTALGSSRFILNHHAVSSSSLRGRVDVADHASGQVYFRQKEESFCPYIILGNTRISGAVGESGSAGATPEEMTMNVRLARATVSMPRGYLCLSHWE